MKLLSPEEIREMDTLTFDRNAAEVSLKIALSYCNNSLAYIEQERNRLVARIKARYNIPSEVPCEIRQQGPHWMLVEIEQEEKPPA